jgi:Fe(3+) dicitrate transport protein
LLDKRAGDLAGLHYAVRDVTAKVGFKTAAGDFGLKSSVYDETSNSTYVGLTEAMYRADPFQHPAPDDRLDVERQALTVSHQVGLRGSGEIRTNAYAYHTERNWRRQDYGFSSDSSAHVFRGTTGNRNREFHVVGLEPRLRLPWGVAGVANDLEAGVRVHYERARDRQIDGATPTASTGILRDDEIREGRALAAFAQNRLFLGSAWHITPGIRLERFSYDRRIITTRVRRQDPAGTTRAPEDVDLRSSDDLFEVIPGIGTAWSPSATATVFAGLHRGFAPPRVKDALIYPDPTLGPGQQVPQLQTLHLDAERSVNYELGVRLGPRPYLALEATAFYLDFSNQIIAPSLSAGAVSQATLANQGATRHRGLEGSITFDVGKALRQPFGLIARLGATHVNATFSRDRYIRAASGDTVNVRGNRLPYAPRLTASGSVTLSAGTGFEARIDGLYVSDQFADNFETVEATPTGLVGRIPSYRVYDLSLRYGIPLLESASLSASVKNLFGTRYIASRRPEGIKPGIPRTAFVGLSVGF